MDLLGLFTGAGAVTGGANILIKIVMSIGRAFNQQQQNNLERLEKLIELEERRAKIEQGNFWTQISAIASRGWMLLLSSLMLVFATIFSALHPDIVVYYPVENNWSFGILGFDLIQGSGAITWQKLQGLIILPIWMMILGAEVSFRYTNAMFEKR